MYSKIVVPIDSSTVAEEVREAVWRIGVVVLHRGIPRSCRDTGLDLVLRRGDLECSHISSPQIQRSPGVLKGTCVSAATGTRRGKFQTVLTEK